MAMNNDIGNGIVIGMDLGGTKLSGALFTREGDIIHKQENLLEGKEGPEVGAMVLQQLAELDEYARNGHFQLHSVGICIPGISNPSSGCVWAPNIPGWEAYPLHREIKNSLSNSDVPVSIESDRNCSILGEIWKGSAQGCSNVIFMAVGTGIGIGIVANGQIINGSDGIAGAIGWLALDRPYLSDYDHCGQFEFYASGTGISRNAESLLKQGIKSEYLQAGEVSTMDVFTAYTNKDQVAIKVMEQSIEYWGMAVANLVSIFNPEKIIFGGGVFGPATQFLDRILEEAGKWAQPISIQQVKLEASTLKGNAGLLGAGYMAINNEFML
jgi:glucokinase